MLAVVSDDRLVCRGSVAVSLFPKSGKCGWSIVVDNFYRSGFVNVASLLVVHLAFSLECRGREVYLHHHPNYGPITILSAPHPKQLLVVTGGRQSHFTTSTSLEPGYNKA